VASLRHALAQIACITPISSPERFVWARRTPMPGSSPGLAPRAPAHQAAETFGPPFARKYLIAHA